MFEEKNTVEQVTSESTPGTTPAANNETTKSKENAEKTFTQDEVNQIIQKRLAKERERFKPLVDSSEEEVKTLIAREKDVTRRELELEAKERLQSEGLPVDLIKAFSLNSKEEFETSYEHITSVFKPLLESAVRDGINQKLRGTVPKDMSTASQNDPIKAVFLPHQM